MAFDENSFSQESFDPLAWLFDVIEYIKRIIKQFVVRSSAEDFTVYSQIDEQPIVTTNEQWPVVKRVRY